MTFIKSLLGLLAKKSEKKNLDSAVLNKEPIRKEIPAAPIQNKPNWVDPRVADDFKENYNWLSTNLPYLIKENRIKGNYALVYNRRIINSGDNRLNLEKEADKKGISPHNVFSIGYETIPQN